MKLAFSRQISEEYSSIKFHDSRPVGVEFYADRRTDIRINMNLIVTFRIFVNAPKNACPQSLHKLGPSCQNNCLSPNWND
jgi:hypothetical protein